MIEPQKYLLRLFAAALLAGAFAEAQEEEEKIYQLDELVIIGENEAISTAAILPQTIGNQTNGVNALENANRTPSFNFSSGDPLGFYEYGQNVQLRIFNKVQIGMTVDGIPLGSQEPAGGSPVGRFVENESIDLITVNQGSATIETPVSFGLGGAIAYTTSLPKLDMGGMLTGTVGQNSHNRLYLRFDTGALGGITGPRAYAAVSRSSFDKWRSAGDQVRLHGEGKVLREFDRGSVSLNLYFNDREDHDFLDMAAAQFDKGQLKTEIINTQTLEPTGGGSLTTEYVVLKDKKRQNEINQYYFDAWTNRREDLLVGVNFNCDLSQTVGLKLTPYWQNQDGVGTWLPPYRVNPAVDDPFDQSDPTHPSWRETQYGLSRFGLTGNMRAEVMETSSVTAGTWVEVARRDQRRIWFELPDRDRADFADVTEYYRQFDRTFDITSLMAFVKGATELLDDRLNLSVGLRTHRYGIEFTDHKGGDHSKLDDSVALLPQLGAVYDLASQHQLFVSFSQNFSQLPDGAAAQQVRRTAADGELPAPESERATSIDLGYRLLRDDLKVSTTLFLVQYQEKLEEVILGAEFDRYADEPVLLNVGGINSLGLEVAGDYTLARTFNFAGSLAVNRSQYTQDIADASEVGGSLIIDGNDAVMVPKVQAFGEWQYVNPELGLRAGINGKYVGARKSSLAGPVGGEPAEQEEIDAYFLAGLFASYRWRDVDISANLYNALNEAYLASISGLGPGTARRPGQASFFPGSPRLFTVELGYVF